MKAQICIYCALLLFVAGCKAVMAGRYNYHLEVRNIGTERVFECGITSDKGFTQRLGLLVQNAGDTTLGPFKYPYADRWTITWNTSKGDRLEKSLDLTDKFPRKFEGRLVFTIDATNNLSYLSESFCGK